MSGTRYMVLEMSDTLGPTTIPKLVPVNRLDNYLQDKIERMLDEGSSLSDLHEARNDSAGQDDWILFELRDERYHYVPHDNIPVRFRPSFTEWTLKVS